jgi:hypothetical protein
MKLDIVRSDINQWCVALNGEDIVGFAGPYAQQRAEAERERLVALLYKDVDNASEQENADVQDRLRREQGEARHG